MEESKRIIIGGIQEKRDSMVSKYNQYDKEIKEEEDEGKLYKKVLLLYKKSGIERDVLINYLNTILKDKFFKESTVRELEGKIVYNSGEYKVKFPLEGNIVEVEDSGLERSHTFGGDEETRLVEMYLEDLEERKRLIKKCYESGSKEDLKELYKHDRFTYIKGISAEEDLHYHLKFIVMRKIRKHYNRELLNKLEDEIGHYMDEHERLKQNWINNGHRYQNTLLYIRSLEDYSWMVDMGYIVKVKPRGN